MTVEGVKEDPYPIMELETFFCIQADAFEDQIPMIPDERRLVVEFGVSLLLMPRHFEWGDSP
jgi:hypothetical protein